MKDFCCCFTGHRKISEIEKAFLEKYLESVIARLIHQGVCYFGAGGAIGFDTLAALVVLKMKPACPQIRLILVLPCKEQGKAWHEVDQKTYRQILDQADGVIYTSEHYHKGCMHKRNRYLVDNSRYCVCYLTDEKGGTAYTVDYAKQKGLQIINLALN